MGNQGLLSRASAALSAPSQSMSWVQLGAATLFVLTLAMGWRQIVRGIMGEI